MDKGDTISLTKKFMTALSDLKYRYVVDMTDTEKNAIDLGVLLYQKELNELNFNQNYKGVA